MKVRAGLRAALALAIGLSARDASACGGCFHEPAAAFSARASVVTDHRMALVLSSAETTLWDQLSWAGNPEDFVWALPLAHADTARVAVGDDALLDALDLTTAPRVRALVPSGCAGDASVDGATAGAMVREEVRLALRPAVRVRDPDAPPLPMELPPEATVGPYETVLLDGISPGQTLEAWLTAHHYAVPSNGRAAVDHYTALQSGWVVLRLRPGEGVARMRPVRITLDGYVPTLPLRMIASGAGDALGVTLFVAAAGPMRVRGADDLRVSTNDLAWNLTEQRSNYDAVFARALATDRPEWVTEAVVPWRVTASEDAARLVAAGGVVTRLRTLARPAVLGRDLVLETSESPPFTIAANARITGVPRCGAVGDGGANALPPLVIGPECACATPGAHGGMRGGALAGLALLGVVLGRRRARASRG